MESSSPPTSHSQQHYGKKAVTPKSLPVESEDRKRNINQNASDATGKDMHPSSSPNSENITIHTKSQDESIEALETARIPATYTTTQKDMQLEAIDTLRLSAQAKDEITQDTPTVILKANQQSGISRGKAILLISLLLIVVLSAFNASYAHFIGPQGWAFVIGGPASTGNESPLALINKELHHNLTPGATAQATPQMTPQQYINLIVQNMSLDQKLGQMMIVQFVGPTYSLDISTMISQYHVGAVLLFTANNNITDKVQLKGLIQQMQSNTAVPMIVAIDQEGGTVDRLQALDGPRSSAADIGATNNPEKAKRRGFRTPGTLHHMVST